MFAQNKSECIWVNARHVFATAVCAFPLTSTCDKNTPIAYTFVCHSSEISFDIRSFTAYSVNIGKRRTNMNERSFMFVAKSILGECTRSLVFSQTHSPSVHVASGFSFNIHSFTTYLTNIGEWQINMTECDVCLKSTLGECTCSLVFGQTHSLSIYAA